MQMPPAPIPKDERPFWVKLVAPAHRPCILAITLAPKYASRPLVGKVVFVLHEPGKGFGIRRDIDESNDRGNPMVPGRRNKDAAFIPTSTTEDMYLPTDNVGAHHANIYWSEDDHVAMIAATDIGEGKTYLTTVGYKVLKVGEPLVLHIGTEIRFGNGGFHDPFANWVIDDISWGAMVPVHPHADNISRLVLTKIIGPILLFAVFLAGFYVISFIAINYKF